MSRRPVSDSDRELMALPSIVSQMPVRFRNGAVWERFNGECKACGQTIAGSRLTGRITRLLESVATIEAVGACEPCRLLTRFHYRFHDDMRITGMTDEGWATWRAKRSFMGRLRLAFKAIRKRIYDPQNHGD